MTIKVMQQPVVPEDFGKDELARLFAQRVDEETWGFALIIKEHDEILVSR